LRPEDEEVSGADKKDLPPPRLSSEPSSRSSPSVSDALPQLAVVMTGRREERPLVWRLDVLSAEGEELMWTELRGAES
jgi:hypothetical protein